jgi:hypothetical protein
MWSVERLLCLTIRTKQKSAEPPREERRKSDNNNAEKTHHAPLHLLSQHHNDPHVLLPAHIPKVAVRRLERALRRDVAPRGAERLHVRRVHVVVEGRGRLGEGGYWVVQVEIGSGEGTRGRIRIKISGVQEGVGRGGSRGQGDMCVGCRLRRQRDGPRRGRPPMQPHARMLKRPDVAVPGGQSVLQLSSTIRPRTDFCSPSQSPL